ncbi:MAG: creatininase family protein [Anaerolineae bacterium]
MNEENLEVRLEALTWVQIERYIGLDDRILLPVGSTEQHGRHLPLGNDGDLAHALARRAAERTGVLVAPVLRFGDSLHHMAFPGTISLGRGTLEMVSRELFASLHRHGFRRILVVNGHGGNIPALRSAVTALGRLPTTLEVRIRSWWEIPEVTAIETEAFGGPGSHADAGETALALAIHPERVRLKQAGPPQEPVTVTMSMLSPEQVRSAYPDGNVGPDPQTATAEVGDRILAAAVGALAQDLETWGPAPVPPALPGVEIR